MTGCSFTITCSCTRAYGASVSTDTPSVVIYVVQLYYSVIVYVVQLYYTVIVHVVQLYYTLIVYVVKLYYSIIVYIVQLYYSARCVGFNGHVIYALLDF